MFSIYTSRVTEEPKLSPRVVPMHWTGSQLMRSQGHIESRFLFYFLLFFFLRSKTWYRPVCETPKVLRHTSGKGVKSSWSDIEAQAGGTAHHCFNILT